MTSIVSIIVFVLGFIVLGVNLKEVQIDESAGYNYANARQSVRRVQTAAPRGCIYDRNGTLLAGNRKSIGIVLSTTPFQKRTWEATQAEIIAAIDRTGKIVGLENPLSDKAVRRHIRQKLSMPLLVWRDIDEKALARFCEHEQELEGFSLAETEERVYPQGRLASHLIGYVGRAEGDLNAGDVKFNFSDREMRGRSGVEHYYDSFLRGVSGEKNLIVDARGFTQSESTIKVARRGLDLTLNLDAKVQRAVEQELKGCIGACVVMDPRNGEVLAFASAPDYDINEFVPILKSELYDSLAGDRRKPLLNRASGGAYAPGSTFKPITALAGLGMGIPAEAELECIGVYEVGTMKLHCARTWGHGIENLKTALRDSCNPYFCNLGMEAGTNAIITAARTMGLGAKTGIDFGVDMAGVVPDDEWKRKQYGQKWYQGDLAQMSIGQSMLLVSPLQMARVAGALGTGYLVTPRIKAGEPVARTKLPFPAKDLAKVREGMELVVSSGSGKAGGEGVGVKVAGKTGTAEVGKGETRRKNTWFIAYAPAENPTVAVAMVVEYGVSGGSTTAPKVGAVLRSIFNG
jgi:penicillin-binding protein 2